MIKHLFLCIFFIGLISSNPKLNTIRVLYKQSSTSKIVALQLYEELKNVKKNSKATLVGYKGASIALKAKYTKGRKKKRKIFKQGILILENEITKNPKNIELRLIRLSIQENVPKVLKYKKNISEDKKFIQSNFKKVKSKKLRNYIKEFVLRSKSFSKEEKTLLSKL